MRTPDTARLKQWLCLVAGVGLHCGGSGDGVVNPIGGEITATAHTITAGDTQTAVSNLTILTTDTIDISGTLRIGENVAVTLITDGDLTITGAILPVESASVTLAKSARPHVTKADTPESAGVQLSSGGNGGTATDAEHAGGDSGYVSITDHDGHASAAYAISTEDYAKGGAGFNGCTPTPKTGGTTDTGNTS